jgi:two-component system, OmpR family, sensor histidine kinase KdpD
MAGWMKRSVRQQIVLLLLILLIIVVAGAAGFIAHSYHRRVAAALIFAFGVVLIAGRSGLKAGLFAALCFSLFYNLILSEPYLRFSLAGVDDLFPLVAFTTSAIASAYIAGRLRDEAKASQEGEARVRSLFELSQALQSTVDLKSMIEAALAHCDGLSFVEIHLSDGKVIAQDESRHGAGLVYQADLFNYGSIPLGDGRVAILERFRGGFVTAVATEAARNESTACCALLSIAAERWVLTQSVMETDVLRRSEQLKTSLLSSLSHDVRTPLSVISASVTSLLQYRRDLPIDTQIDLLERIRLHAERLNRLTEKLLSLGRIEGGLSPDKMAVVDAMEILGSALRSVRAIAGRRQIKKSFGVKTALVRADAPLLEQVFFNVLENAIVHSPADCLVTILTATSDTNFEVHIDDEGQGVSDCDAELIFNRFEQGSAIAKQSTGSGLGLSIARGFARAIGGEVKLSDKPDGSSGARFTISLPLTKNADDR